MIHYQGRLSDTSGTPLSGTFQVTIRLYDAAADGTAVWQETHTITLARADNGLFSVNLGTVTPFGQAVDFNQPMWLTTEVNGEGELSPRQPLSAVGYAINADLLDGMDSATLLSAAQARVQAAGLPEDVSRLGQSVESNEVTDGTLTAGDTAANFLTAGTGVQVQQAGPSWQISATPLAALDAGQLTGTVAEERLPGTVSRLGPSIESAEVTDGTLTAADTAPAFLAAGSGVTVTRAAGSWDISAVGSGGDITGVAAGAGLTGGGASGDVALALSTPVSVSNGGTGAVTSLAARGNLQAAASGANTDITALGGLTTPLSVAQGGTGAATAAGARANLISCMPIGGADSAGRTATFQMGTFGASDTGGKLDRLWPVPADGTVTGLRAFVGQAPGAGSSWTVRLRKNGANASLTCTISTSATSCAAAGSGTVAAGDRLGVEFTKSGSAANTQGSGWSACFVPE